MKHLLDNRYKILSCLTFRYLINIHKYCNKRCLSICCHKRDNLILNYLNTTVNLFLYTLFCDKIDLLLCYRDSCFFHLLANHTTEFLTADLYKRCKMCQWNTLSAILWAGYLCDGLCCNVTCSGKALWLFKHSLTDYSAILQHVLKINQTTVVHVLCIIICIMEMNDSSIMCLHNILWQQKSSCKILIYLTCNVVPLYTVYSRILIWVFLLYLFVVALKNTLDTFISCIVCSG